tara:strand:+ start:271 stop:612 length:342 start_codon:yes stop_codon:yes gene_type:complete
MADFGAASTKPHNVVRLVHGCYVTYDCCGVESYSPCPSSAAEVEVEFVKATSHEEAMRERREKAEREGNRIDFSKKAGHSFNPIVVESEEDTPLSQLFEERLAEWRRGASGEL